MLCFQTKSACRFSPPYDSPDTGTNDSARPPKTKKAFRAPQLRRRSARVRTHNGRRARASRPILETSLAAITDTHLPAGVRTGYCVLALGPTTRSTRPAQHRAGCSARQHTLRAHPSRAERRAAALTGAPGTAAAPRGVTPGRRMLRREMGVCDSAFWRSARERATSARGPRSTFDFPVSALCAVRA